MTQSEKKMPSGWCTATLGEVAAWGSGGTPSRKNNSFFTGSIPWIKTGELGDKYIRNAEEKITKEAIENSSAKVFPKGSVGIAMYGATVGKVSIFGIDASTNQACAVAKPFPCALFNEFLYYYLLSEKSALIKEGKGGAQPNISQGLLKDRPIPLPSINEQHRIVAKIEELFSELDKGIESLKTAREQLKVYRQALLKHAFEGKLTEQWRKDNADKLETADQLLERIKQERETRYQQQLEDWKAAVKQWEAGGKEGKKPSKPRKYNPTILDDLERLSFFEGSTGWVWVNFSELLYSIRGGTTTPPIDDETEFPILRSSSIRNGIIHFNDIRYLTKEGIKSEQDFVVTGDLLFSRLNGTIDYVGNCAAVNPEFPDNLLYPDRLYCAKLVDTSLAAYCEYFFASPVARKHIENKAKSTAGHKRISIPDVTELPLPMTSTEEMSEIVSVLDEKLSIIDSNVHEIEKNIRTSETLRQSILKKAFSGQLVPQDPNDEPASVLLERIAKEKEAVAAKAKKAKTAKKKVTRTRKTSS